ncbi:MAG: hypothetical protein ACOVP6_03910 [Lacibacter sp.]
MKSALSIVFSFLILLSGCSKTNQSKETVVPPTETVIEGVITAPLELPTGSSVNLATLIVQSPVANGTVTGGAYTVTSYTNQFTTDFVVNANQEVIMMGYHIPGQKDLAISATTTALALMMNSQSVLFLSDEGKRLLVAKVLADPKFLELKTVVEETIRSNRNILDETNDLLIQKLGAAQAGIAQRIQQIQGGEAVLLNKVGNTLYFQNNSNANSAVIGVYKDGSRIKKLVVDGLQFVPTSVNETFNGYQGISADPVQYPFAFEGDGVYEFKVRTGRPTSDDGSVEHNEAFYQNLAWVSYNLMCVLTPALKSTSCNKATILTNIIGFLMSAPDILGSRNAYAALHDAYSLTFQNLDFIIGDCLKKSNTNYFSSLSKAFSFIDKAFTVIGTSANITFFSKDWISTNPVWDTCMTVNGNQVSSCAPAITTSIVDSITSNSAVTGGNVTSEGGAPITMRGVCYSTNAKPTTSNSIVSPEITTGSGPFLVRFAGLSSKTTYYIRAYARNKFGTIYGNERSFKTL